MSKIEVRHSSIVVNDYNIGDAPKLEKFFTVWDKLTHTAYPKAIKYDEERKMLYLPRGMDIPYLENKIGSSATLVTKHDKIARIEPIMLKYLPRDDTQKTAIKFFLGEDEYRYTKAKSQLAVNLNPGEGKTYLSIAAAAYFQIRTAMITSSLGWIDQWKDRILEYTDTKPNEIYIIAGVGTIARILNGMTDVDKIKFVLISHATLKSYGDKYGWNKVGELFNILGIGLKIYDEAHLDFDNICAIDFATNTFKTVYLTATPARSNEGENIIYQMAFRSVPALDLFDDEVDPRTDYIALHYNSHPSAQEIQHCRNAYGFDMLKYVNYVSRRPNFYKLIYVLAEIIKKKGKTLIYIGKNSVIEDVYRWMEYNIPELRGQIGIYNSTVPKDIKQAQLSKHVILSTVKSCGAAIDIPDLKLTVVLAEPFKSEVIARQSLGRTRDRDTMYIDVVDGGFSALKGYYKHKQGIFGRYAKTYTDIKLSDYELDQKVYAINEARNEYYRSTAANIQSQTKLEHVVDRVKIS